MISNVSSDRFGREFFAVFGGMSEEVTVFPFSKNVSLAVSLLRNVQQAPWRPLIRIPLDGVLRWAGVVKLEQRSMAQHHHPPLGQAWRCWEAGRAAAHCPRRIPSTRPCSAVTLPPGVGGVRPAHWFFLLEARGRFRFAQKALQFAGGTPF